MVTHRKEEPNTVLIDSCVIVFVVPRDDDVYKTSRDSLWCKRVVVNFVIDMYLNLERDPVRYLCIPRMDSSSFKCTS
jgi:hypothetical protein